MFKSKKWYLIHTTIMLASVVFLITDIIIHWNSKLKINEESLFLRIILSLLFTFRTIDYFLEWHNHEKLKTNQE